MYAYSVTIGRNISAAHPVRAHQPLTLTEWSEFVEEIESTLGIYLFRTDDMVETHYGKGQWQGIEEESAKVTLLKSSSLEDAALTDLRETLYLSARTYGQDAVCLTIGESKLIGQPQGTHTACNHPAMTDNGV